MFTWWRRWQTRRQAERRPIIAMAWIVAMLRSDHDAAEQFRRELDGRGGER